MKAYVANNPIYDQNPNYIQTIRIEATYAAYVMLSANADLNTQPISITELSELPEEFETLFDVNRTVQLNGLNYPYGVCLFNKWCGFSQIKIPQFTSNNNISDKIYKDSKNNNEYQTRLSLLDRKLFWYSSLNTNTPLTLPLDEIISLNVNQHKPLFAKLPKNPFIGQHIYKGLVQRVYDSIPEEHFFKRLINAKLGKVATQLARMIAAIGYIADAQNIIDSYPLKDSVLNGLAPDAFFRTATGARKGLVDKSEATPASGYLERSLVVNLSPVEIGSNDCGTDLGFNIHILSEKHAKSLINRYYRDDSGIWKLFKKENIDSSIGKTLSFRSPISCNEPGFKICRKCFGEYDVKTPYVGILAGQYISERMTQLSMRTFHTSGSCDIELNPNLIDLMFHHIQDIIYLTAMEFKLVFNKDLTENEIEWLSEIEGYVECISNNEVKFHDIYGALNQDVTKVIREINQLLKKESGRKITPIDEVYHKYIKSILDNGDIYSTFVEIVLCNMYLTSEGEVLRYVINRDPSLYNDITMKLTPKTLNRAVSKLLGLLYEPNAGSICNFADSTNPLPVSTNTVFEKLWSGMF